MTQAIRLELRPSRWLVGCLIILHAAALGAAFVSLSFWILLPVAAGVAMSAVVVIRSALLVLSNSVRELELSADRSVRWKGKGGDVHEVTFAQGGFACAWLVILALDPVEPTSRSARRWIVLAPDSADQEALRQLRVCLRTRHSLGIPPDNHATG